MKEETRILRKFKNMYKIAWHGKCLIALDKSAVGSVVMGQDIISMYQDVKWLVDKIKELKGGKNDKE